MVQTSRNRTVKLVLDRVAPSVNSAYYFKRIGKRTIKIKTVKAKQFFEYVKDKLKQIDYVTFTGPVEVSIKLIFGNKQRHDIDNYQKLTNDSLCGAVWLDDNQIHKITTEKFYVKGCAKTIIEVKPYKQTEVRECQTF